MGIFNNSNYFSYAGVPVIEGDQYDVDFGGAANIAMESYEDQLSIVKAIHAADMAELGCKAKIRNLAESYNSTYDAEYELHTIQEASIGEIFTNIKDGIKKFFAKIGDFFKKLYLNFVTMKKSNKSFAEKYKNVLSGIKTYAKPVTVTGYKYTEIDTIIAMCKEGVDNIDKFFKEQLETIDTSISKVNSDSFTSADADKFKEITEKLSDNIILSLAGKTSSPEGQTLTETMYLVYRNNQSTKSSQSYSYDDIVSALGDLEKLDPKVLKKIEDATNKGMDKILKSISNAESTYKKLPDDNKNRSSLIQMAQSATKTMTQCKNASMTSISVMRNITNDYANQIKTATVKMVAEARGAKKEADKKK